MMRIQCIQPYPNGHVEPGVGGLVVKYGGEVIGKIVENNGCVITIECTENGAKLVKEMERPFNISVGYRYKTMS